MSLFGTSPLGSEESATSKSRNSLFEDDFSIVTPVPKSFLFSGTDSLSSPPRDISVTNKSAGKRVMRNLPHLSPIPIDYDEIFTKTRKNGNDGNSIKVDEITNILADSRLSSQDERMILQILFQGSQQSDLTRNEFNIMLALVGLAQNNEEITLDSILQRKNNLPVPILTETPKPLTPLSQPNNIIHNSPPKSSVNTETTKFTSQKAYLYFPESDPWANSNSYHNHTSPDINDTANEETHNQSCRSIKSDDQARSSAPIMNWGSVKAGNVDNTFSRPAVDRTKLNVNGLDNHTPRNSPGYPIASSQLNNVDEETILVTLLPEKEGLFMFQHHCYHVISVKKGRKVVRRFSDFVWLLDCLHLRFPFRQLPLLPPKRVGFNGSHLAADNKFLEKRRRGLARFSNSLTRHPVLSKDNLVFNFLTLSTVSCPLVALDLAHNFPVADEGQEFSVWRKQASTSIQEEFIGKQLDTELEAAFPSTLDDLFESTRVGVRRSAAIYINLCSLIERLSKRNEGFAADQLRISRSLELLSDVTPDTYTINTNNVSLLNGILMTSARKLIDSQELMIDEAKSWDEGVLEDFKKQRDSLVSMRELFDRRDLYNKDNISQLERAIEKNKSKLEDLDNRPGGDYTEQIKKLKETIKKDKDSIELQHSRNVFVKQCIREELDYFQNTQIQIHNLSKNWALELVKYSELQADNWKQLREELEKLAKG